ncbi:MAG: DUF222 domain-containing protein [Nocardioides sp.]
MTAVAGIHAALDEVAASGVDPMYASTRDKKSLLVDLTRLQARVDALRAEVLAVAEDVAVQTADRTAATWLATEARVEVRDLLAAERLGGRLRHHWPAVAAAAKDGAISWEQAQIITGALDQLPTDLDAELVGKAEAHLVTEAGQFGPRPLRRLARKILDVDRAGPGRRPRTRPAAGRGRQGTGCDPPVVPATWGRHHRPPRTTPRPDRQPAPGLPRGLHLTPTPRHPARARHRQRIGGRAARGASAG